VVERLLTLAEVAELLRVAEATLYRQRYLGEPPGSLGFRVGGLVRYRPSDLEAWLNQLHSGSSGRGR
jgi:predicted DNA-binding transcriptional regulator AlpA